jgi:hypothetical protein
MQGNSNARTTNVTLSRGAQQIQAAPLGATCMCTAVVEESCELLLAVPLSMACSIHHQHVRYSLSARPALHASI